MRRLKEDIEKILRRLVGTWDFVLTVQKSPEPISRCYVVRGLSETGNNMVAFGHDLSDLSAFNIMISPVTIDEKDYLFWMADMDARDSDHMCSRYIFNQHTNIITGIFDIMQAAGPLITDWDPDPTTILMSGDFIGFRRPDPDN